MKRFWPFLALAAITLAPFVLSGCGELKSGEIVVPQVSAQLHVRGRVVEKSSDDFCATPAVGDKNAISSTNPYRPTPARSMRSASVEQVAPLCNFPIRPFVMNLIILNIAN
jgi:hypothetical protein